MITLTGGTMFLMWLGEQITARGIGNGISLIIFAGIVADLPSALGQMLGARATGAIAAILVDRASLSAWSWSSPSSSSSSARSGASSCSTRSARVGNRMFGGESSHLPLKLNTSGVIPPIFASSLLLLPLTVASFYADQRRPAGMAADR